MPVGFFWGRLGGYEEAAMFTNIMTGPIVIDVAGVSALGQGLAYCEDKEARRSDKWKTELVQRLALIVPGNAEARALRRAVVEQEALPEQLELRLEAAATEDGLVAAAWLFRS